MKKFLLSFALIFFSSFLFCEVNDISSIRIAASGKQLSSSENNYLPENVANKLEANISKYTDIKIINETNLTQILKAQAQSESDAYNSNIQLGKLTTASHILFLTVTKESGKYSVTFRLTNVEDGTAITLQSGRAVKETEELYQKPGCVIDLMTIELCERLGISLTPTERIVLQYGNDGLSYKEQGILIDEEIENIQKRMKELDKEIDLTRNRKDVDEAALEKSKLQTLKTIEEQKLIKAKEDKRRREEEEKRRENDELKNLKRSEEQRLKIESMTNDLDEKLDELREEKAKEASVLAQIKQIETLKEIYINRQIEIEKAVFTYRANATKDKLRRKKEIENRPLANSEMTKEQTITETAKANRKAEYEKYASSVDERFEKEASEFTKRLREDQETLLKDIKKGYKNLKGHTITSLNDELIVDFGNYDGEECKWDLAVTVQSDGIILFKTVSSLYYKDLTGKEPVKRYGEDGYEEYNNDIDFYVSMFSRNEPYLTFALDYDVKPMGENEPSKYAFIFSNLRFYLTENLKLSNGKIRSRAVHSNMPLASNIIEKQMLPVLDMRDKDAQKKEETRIAEKKIQEEKIQDFKHDVKDTTEEFMYKLKTHNWGRTQASFNVGFINGEKTSCGATVEGEASFGILPFLYVNYRANYFGVTNDKNGYYNKNKNGSNVFYNTWGLGLNLPLEIAELFLDFGIGFNSYYPTGYGEVIDSTKRCEFITNLSFGSSYFFNKHFIINGTLNIMMNPLNQVNDSELNRSASEMITNVGFAVGCGLRL